MVELTGRKRIFYLFMVFIFFLLILPVTGLIPGKVSIPPEESLLSEESPGSDDVEDTSDIRDENKKPVLSEEPVPSEETSVSDDIEDTGDLTDENMTFFILPGEVSVKFNDTFSVQIGIENAIDMYGWQVFLLFDQQILECTDIYMPPDEVFSYGVTAGEALVEYNATEFTNPLYKIYDGKGEILVGNCLHGANQSNFNGSGILFQADFRAISTGISVIELRMQGKSYIIDSEIESVTPLPKSVYLPVNCTG